MWEFVAALSGVVTSPLAVHAGAMFFGMSMIQVGRAGVVF